VAAVDGTGPTVSRSSSWPNPGPNVRRSALAAKPSVRQGALANPHGCGRSSGFVVARRGGAPARQAGGHWFEPSTAHEERPWKRGLSCSFERVTPAGLWFSTQGCQRTVPNPAATRVAPVRRSRLGPSGQQHAEQLTIWTTRRDGAASIGTPAANREAGPARVPSTQIDREAHGAALRADSSRHTTLRSRNAHRTFPLPRPRC
jgi:hypothetical protein